MWDSLLQALNSPWFIFITFIEFVSFLLFITFLTRLVLYIIGLKEEDGKKYQVLRFVLFFLLVLLLSPFKPLVYLAHHDSYLSAKFLDVILFSELHFWSPFALSCYIGLVSIYSFLIWVLFRLTSKIPQ